jgi:hypothetical protein
VWFRYIPGQFTTFAFSGFVRQKGESGAFLEDLWAKKTQAAGNKL